MLCYSHIHASAVQAVSYQFAGLENILPGSLCDYDSQYEDCV